MINIKNITAKNFLSIGNVTQAINFDQITLTLILGENLDRGEAGEGHRNGVGKTAILNALSYALYGQALTNIRKENLINNINKKGMLVTVEFEKNGTEYKIQRGRKPNVLKLFINGTEQEQSTEDEAQGDSRETQKYIDSCLGMSHLIFKQLIALNTYSEAFLSMRVSDQREVIEQVLGITLLSEKAENLKNKIKEIKEIILSERLKIEATQTANSNIQKSIDSLEIKSKAWESKRQSDMVYLANSIVTYEDIDIDKEVEQHMLLEKWLEKSNKSREIKKQLASYQSALIQAEKATKKYEDEIAQLNSQTCPMCSQELHSEKHEEMLTSVKNSLKDAEIYHTGVKSNIATLEKSLSEISEMTERPITFYETYSDALDHKNQLENLKSSLESKADEINTYREQIDELKKTALQVIDWTIVNENSALQDHQEMLLKLLTNKESFIRKKIINQSLTYLNKRLCYYLDKTELPHSVIFKDDLSVEITEHGEDLDFDNLSRGERNRLILSLSFAFRDVWENLYDSVNILFVDELLDSGLDTAGVEAGLSVLKNMSRERNKTVYLISHKEELVGRVNNVLKATKINGFTSYSISTEHVEIH